MKKVGRPDMRPMREKTLEELEGFVAGDAPFDSYLVRTIFALRKKPIGEFTIEDLRITIGQGRGIPYLLPLALERLEADPLSSGDYYRGDLLMNVLHAEPYWGGDTTTRAQVRRVIERALEQLEGDGLEPSLREALGKLS